MKRLSSILPMLACAQFVCAQDRNYTAVNPLLFSYADSDVYVQPPQKHNNGRQIMSPDSFKYPWENHLDNGMPNALVDIHGNVAVYFSSFLVYSPTPPSKVGAMVFVNDTENYYMQEVKAFIDNNHHLPDVPSAEDVADKGYSQHELNKALLQKVEELTLYVIQLEDEIKALKGEAKQK